MYVETLLKTSGYIIHTVGQGPDGRVRKNKYRSLPRSHCCNNHKNEKKFDLDFFTFFRGLFVGL